MDEETRIEMILWFDPTSQDEWTEDLKPEPNLIQSIGILAQETSDTVSLALNKDLSDDKGKTFSCIMHIPKGVIKTRIKLKSP